MIAYVRHYLTGEGIKYFQNTWFPRLSTVIKQQLGFISLTYTMNPLENDRIDIVLIFKDEATFNAWCELPIHDEFVVALDAYRSRDYWEAALTDNECDSKELEWMRIVPEPI